MPFVRIDLPAGKPPGYGAAVSSTVQVTLHDVFGVPMAERFHAVAEHPPGTLSIDQSYLGVQRSVEALVIQVTLNRGRDAGLKQQFYQALADALHAKIGIRREDVIVSLVEVGREDWSFGDGKAQLVSKELVR
jgi:4-oxalocrotonate tautomerase